MPEVEYQKFLPKGITKAPETVREALLAAKAVLQDEQHWKKGDWFTNLDPNHDPEDAFCNSWEVCAEGAIGIVTIGNLRVIHNSGQVGQWGFSSSAGSPADSALFGNAVDALRAVLPTYTSEVYDDDTGEYVLKDDCAYDGVPWFNDDPNTKYQDVINAFDRAIEGQSDD